MQSKYMKLEILDGNVALSCRIATERGIKFPLEMVVKLIM